MLAGFILDFGADIAHATTLMSDANGARERVFGHTQQIVRSLVDNSNGNSRGIISNPTLLNDTDVELHYVAILNSTLAADTVDNFVVKRDTNVSGKNTVSEPITKKRAFHTGVVHEIRGCLVHFLRCDSGANQVADLVQDV